MKTMRFMAFAIAVLIAVLLPSAVQGQKVPVQAEVGPFVTFKGVEISAGHQDLGEAYGWMCYARTTGTLPGNVTLSMNYEGKKAPGTTSAVTGGAWTLPVYELSALPTARTMARPIRIDGYQGALFGIVENGTVTWDKAGTTASLELKLLIQGGTQAQADLRGTAVLYGTITYDEKGAGTFGGTIYFEFQ